MNRIDRIFKLFDEDRKISGKLILSLDENELSILNSISGKTIQEKIYNFYHSSMPIICKTCNLNFSRFYGLKKGYSKFCSTSCANKYNNPIKNKILNQNRKRTLSYKEIEKLNMILLEYTSDNNDKTIRMLSDKHGIKYNILRKYISENKPTDFKGLQKKVKNVNFVNSVDERLFDDTFLQTMSDNKKSLGYVASILNIAPNTVRLYAKTKGIVFSGSESLSESELFDFLSNLKIKNIERRNRTAINPFEIDVYLPDYKLGIELHGEYWHSERTHDKNYHLNKHNLAKNKGIELIQIFEHEWKNKKDIIFSMLKSRLNLNKKIYARKCELRILDKKESRLFFNENHIQGTSNHTNALGLYYNNILVSAISFGKSRYNKNYQTELLRFCNKKDINVVGGFSKLLKNSFKLFSINTLITYSHIRLFKGDVYSNVGMKFLRKSPPGYFWTKGSQILSRYKTQKHKLPTNKSEVLYMKENGWFRVWDCGQNVYELIQ